MDAERSPKIPFPRAGATRGSASSEPPGYAVRRHSRRVAPRSTQGVLLRVIREVLDPNWTPAEAARAIVAQVGGELGPLRGARERLLAGSSDRSSVSHARALATIDLAIAQIELAGSEVDVSNPSGAVGPPVDDGRDPGQHE